MPTGSKWSSRTTCLQGHVYLATTTAKRTMADGSTKVYRVRRCRVCDKNRRKTGRPVYWRRLLTHCPKNHPYEGENLGIVDWAFQGKEREYRQCRACRREVTRRAHRKWLAKRKAAA